MRLNKTILSLICCCILVLLLVKKKWTNKNVNLKLLLKNAVATAELGGNVILHNTDNLKVRKKGLTKEGLEDKVTSADILSHCAMLKEMRDQFQNVHIRSEESDAICSDESISNILKDSTAFDHLEDKWVNGNDITIWIDPLDATYEFTEKLYQYVTTMVCIALDGKPIIGVIHKPFQNFTSWAWVGQAKSNDLGSIPQVKNQETKVTISRSHSGKIREILDAKLHNYELIVAAGAGFKSLQVAHGEVDAYLHITAIKKWDICAGNAILSSLGGQMTDRHNNQISFDKHSEEVNNNGVIATLQNHELFVDILK